MAEAEWQNAVDSKPKLRTYKTFKSTYGRESYIDSYIPKYERSLISQLRIGILPLRIETGRYSNIRDPISGNLRKLLPFERVCELCDTNRIEDEQHFVCLCPKYDMERKVLFDRFSSINNEFVGLNVEDKFICIMRNANKHLGKFIKDAWLIRKNFLYR